MIQFVECDSEKIISELVSQFEAVLGEKLQPSDERRIFLNQLAQVIVGIRSNINDSGNQVLLRYARGEALDAIGELLGVPRLTARYAKCTLKFTISSAQAVDVIVPKGTRATPDGNVYFSTDEPLIILAGNTEGEVGATAVDSGSEHNGIVENRIIYIVDYVPYLATVSNTSETFGGAEEESDDNYRERIRLVPESFSTAGCIDSYIYWAKSASADVGDVIVYSPVNDTTLTDEERQAGAGKVFVYILKADGTIPEADDDLLKTVLSVVSAKDKRPLTDFVQVLPPNAVNYSISFSYYISEENILNAVDIQRAVNEAVNEYIEWQGGKIGRDINPDKLRNLVLNAGASRVLLTSPTYTTLNNTQIGSLTGEITATYAGLSE